MKFFSYKKTILQGGTTETEYFLHPVVPVVIAMVVLILLLIFG